MFDKNDKGASSLVTTLKQSLTARNYTVGEEAAEAEAVAVVGVNAGLFFFVFGPFGMIKTTSIHIATYIAPILALVGVVFSRCIAILPVWYIAVMDGIEPPN